MPRVKRGIIRRAKRRKLLARAKGFYQTKSKLYRAAKEAVDTSLNYAFIGKRDFRRLWITRIGAAARLNGVSYSQLMHGLKIAGVALDRKSLADLAVRSPEAFTHLSSQAKEAQANIVAEV